MRRTTDDPIAGFQEDLKKRLLQERTLGQKEGYAKALEELPKRLLLEVVDRFEAMLIGNGVPVTRSLSVTPPVAARTARGHRGPGRYDGKPCPIPGCTQKHGGPRNSFLCEIHQALPVAEQAKYRKTVKV